MALPLKPILSALRHHRLTAALLTLQVALTCAIVINAGFLLVERIQRIDTASGLVEDELSVVSARGLDESANAAAQQRTDLAALRALDGVKAAAAINGGSLPLSSNIDMSGACASQADFDRAKAARDTRGIAGCISMSLYSGSDGMLEALGLRLLAGRDFTAAEREADKITAVIVSRTLAQRLWPGESPVGKQLYGFEGPVPVVGMIADILSPVLGIGVDDHMVMLTARNRAEISSTYVLRSAPQDRQRVMHAAAAALDKAGPVRLIPEDGQRTYSQIRRNYFQRDTTMLGLLLASSLALLFVTALGIGGLANFWVGQRTRQIGIRRAVGATRRDILRHFQTENFLIVGAGVVLGMLLAYGLNQLLMRQYELDRLPLFYLPIGAAVLWALGQLAVLGPALRATRVPPAIGTRGG
ncbi:FtsX-like permease family protein [Pseudoxanthomonas sp. X-1]|uniref:ABC transporter permease n=1 Tax=Pseudoxanthomonas sp. X-1 TaxID=2571115 RepID=UPI00110ACCF8|nr:FtsX-like permease family protein [Pseudoxanthomonas sp. X-1]TMN19029.1 FtsX-like permease family protein [Pseudoxanthomonas sp. X-1]UAY74220.1 FtsX-like permease family protein [Pseudoxanthomonas sp. X-1]